MPDNQAHGELEDFVATMIRSDDPIWPLSKAYVNGIPSEHRKFRAHKVQRAQVYAWTSTLRNPGGLLAAATAEADLNVYSELGRMFAKWLGDLFDVEVTEGQGTVTSDKSPDPDTSAP